MYCDDEGAIKGLPLNVRASGIARCCGKMLEVREAAAGPFQRSMPICWGLWCLPLSYSGRVPSVSTAWQQAAGGFEALPSVSTAWQQAAGGCIAHSHAPTCGLKISLGSLLLSMLTVHPPFGQNFLCPAVPPFHSQKVKYKAVDLNKLTGEGNSAVSSKREASGEVGKKLTFFLLEVASSQRRRCCWLRWGLRRRLLVSARIKTAPMPRPSHEGAVLQAGPYPLLLSLCCAVRHLSKAMRMASPQWLGWASQSATNRAKDCSTLVTILVMRIEM